MELKDTVELMNGKDYKERFRGEYFQLVIRIRWLANMLQKYKEGTLSFKPSCSYELLRKQLESMMAYKDILEERAKIENIYLAD